MWKAGIKEKLGEVLPGNWHGTPPSNSTPLIRSGRRILVGSIKRRLWVWSVAYTWVYRRRTNDWLHRGFYCSNGGFVLKNPVPETLAGHGLRVTVGVFGVLFLLLGNFLKITIWITWIDLIIRVTRKKYFQRPKKTIKTPNTPFSRSDRER
jgi:hypothetical protein